MPPLCSSQLVQGKVLKLSKGGFAQDRCLSIKVPDTCVLRYKFRALDLIKRCTFIYFLSIPENFQVILYREIWDILDPSVPGKDKKRKVVKKAIKPLRNKKHKCLEGGLKKAT